MDEKIKLHEKGKFFLHYFNRPWPVFKSTLLEACSEAQKKRFTDKKVKLYKITSSVKRVDFSAVINEIRLIAG